MTGLYHLSVIIRELGAPTTYHGRHPHAAPSFEVISRSRSSCAHYFYSYVLLRHCASQFLGFGLSTETVLEDPEAITFALLRFVAGTPATTSGATSGSLDNQDHCMNGSPFYAMFGYFDIFWPCSW
jgi:hypothetical protein